MISSDIATNFHRCCYNHHDLRMRRLWLKLIDSYLRRSHMRQEKRILDQEQYQPCSSISSDRVIRSVLQDQNSSIIGYKRRQARFENSSGRTQVRGLSQSSNTASNLTHLHRRWASKGPLNRPAEEPSPPLARNESCRNGRHIYQVH